MPLIQQYNMTKEEAIAFKLSIKYIELAHKIFPEYKHTGFTRKDPRKSYLFKCCYKLYQETKDKLALEDYQWYIRAQLDVLKNIGKKDGVNIGPQILVGKNSWPRYVLWRKSNQKQEIKPKVDDIIVALHSTKLFLEKKLGVLDSKTLRAALDSRVFFKWVLALLVSPYYLALSPVVRSWLDEHKPDLEHFIPDITDELKNELNIYFKREFSYEYASSHNTNSK